LETFHPAPNEDEGDLEEDMALAAALLEYQSLAQSQPVQSHSVSGYWQNQAWKEQIRRSF
jgi:hypothetical protein